MGEIEHAIKLNNVKYLDENSDLDRLRYLEKLHGSNEGWITSATKIAINPKYDKWDQWHYRYSDLKELDFTGENKFISMNSFFIPSRATKNVKEINALYVDLDFYREEITKDQVLKDLDQTLPTVPECFNNKFTHEQVLMNLEENYFNKTIPMPSYIINSGRGMYLIWLINTVPYKALPLWNTIQGYLCKQLKDLKADTASDASRVLRVPGSINSKSKSRVTIMQEYDYIYDLREIQQEFLPEEEEKKEKLKKENFKKKKPKEKARSSKVGFIHTERSLNYSRVQDFKKLCELRGYNMVGYREKILFFIRYHYCNYDYDKEKALKEIIELNKKFVNPLREYEVVKSTESAEKCFEDEEKQYNYSNERLIRELNITDEEQKHMCTIISDNEYKRRKRIRNKENYEGKLKAKGKLTKKEEVAIRRTKIKDLFAEGLTQKQIYTVLNISKRTCINDMQFLKEQGLI